MNWDDTRVFLTLSREKTLRSAAKILDIDQATVGRRMAALEQSLGTVLFLRGSSGYELTLAGEAALISAEKMERHAIELQRQLEGLDNRLTGEVRITSTDSLTLDFLIPALQQLHRQHPDISVRLHAATTMLNLNNREADIAVRTIKPDNPDLVTRRLASWPMGLFASAEYLQRLGEPAPGTAFAGHDLVLYHPFQGEQKTMALVGESISQGRVVSRVNSSLMLRTAIAAGLGLGEIPLYMGAADGLIRVWPERQRQNPYEVWLVTHQDLRHTARIRAVISQISNAFATAIPPATSD